MTAFGYAMGNANRLNGWKVVVLLFVLYIFLQQFDRSALYMYIMIGTFLLGYFLPHLGDMGGFGNAISDAINAFRYRSAYDDIKRREAEVEHLRKEYQQKLKDQQRQQAEQERSRRRQHTRQKQEQAAETNRSNSKSGNSSSRNTDQSRDKQHQQSRSSTNTKGRRGQHSSNKYKRAEYQRKRADTEGTGKPNASTRSQHKNTDGRRSSGSHQRRQQEPTTQPPQNMAVRDAFLAELNLSPGNYQKAEIKLAFRRMVKVCHPDRHQNKSQVVIDEMTEQLRRVKAAYEWLYLRALD